MIRAKAWGCRSGLVAAALTALGLPVWAADVTRPAEVAGVAATKTVSDVLLTWPAVTLDAAGNAETVSQYRVYRASTPDFVPNAGNRIGTPAGPTFADSGAASNANNYFYLVTAVDAAGNESANKPSSVTTPATLTGNYTDTTIELQWTQAQPVGQVSGYRIYYGKKAKRYDFTKDVGLSLSSSMTGLELNVNWYFAVAAIDSNGNESAFSNEYIDAVAGRVKLRAHNDDYLCWGASKCVPNSPDKVQRSDGWQLNVPVDFPVGDWKKITVTYTIDSRLCKAGQNGTTDKCGGTNPGGYNTCGDPWDRIANLYLVLDESCITNGASCINNNQLELMRAITPFGTDAPAPLGDGVIPPRVLTLDVTPYATLLTGRKYVGAEIGHFVQAGWHVTVDFNFSKRPEEASPDKPAAAVQVVGFGGAPLPTRSVSIPAGATKVMMRVFTSGHGGTQYCDGGSNNGATCTSSANCPGGSCQNCDEFCHRTNRILRNGSVIWSQVPWKAECQAGPIFRPNCWDWNACGLASCLFPRAGWCPGVIACHTDSPCDNDLDMTSQLAAGGTYNIDYDVLVNRGSWSVSLVMYWYLP